MKKKIYLRIFPEKQHDLNKTMRKAVEAASTVENVKRIEAQVGFTGKQYNKQNKP